MERLKILREKMDLNQADVARALNISRQSYNFYENGKRDPDTGTLKRIATYFGVSIDYLLGHNAPITANLLEITPEDLELLKQIKKASPEKRKALELILGIKEEAATVAK